MGIDPSLNGTGLSDAWDQAFTLRFAGRKSDQSGDNRLVSIRTIAHAACGANEWDDCMTTVVAIESVPPYAKGSAALGLVQGVVREAAAAAGAQVYSVAPSVVKRFATGSGKASKDDMRAALPDHVPSDEWDDNAVDAWWIREIAMATQGEGKFGTYTQEEILRAVKRL